MRRLGLLALAVVASVLVVTPGGITAPPVLPAAASCGSMITRDTTLSTDLIGCLDGFIVTGPVTLDLGGHRVAGTGQGVGILAIGGATVINGAVTGFASGLVLEGATVQSLRIANNDIGVESNDVPSGAFSVRDNQITRNELGMAMLGGSGDVTDNRVTFNTADGIDNAEMAEPVLYANNDVSHNGGRGIYSQDTTTRFLGNSVNFNASDGIHVSDVYGTFFPYWFAGNVADNNGGFGIAFTGVPNSVNPLATVDGGGNEAKHNANPVQCLNIACAFNRGLAKDPPAEEMRLHHNP